MSEQTADMTAQRRAVLSSDPITTRHAATGIHVHVQQIRGFVLRQIELVSPDIQPTGEVGLFLIPVWF